MHDPSRASCSPVRIVAGAASADEVHPLQEAGADELYCGFLPESWIERFDLSATLSRRQGRSSNLATEQELRRLLENARQLHLPVALALNVRYTRGQDSALLALLDAWEDLGGNTVILSDLGLLIALREKGSRLDVHLSIVAATMNSQAVAFFGQWGIRRVVLPRELGREDCEAIADNSNAIQLEALVLNDLCQFIDGLCGFHHSVAYPRAAAKDVPGKAELPVVKTFDPAYSGHGCALSYRCDDKPVRHIRRTGGDSPHCGACAMAEFVRMGIVHLKIAGRGQSTSNKLRGIRFIHDVRRLLDNRGRREPGELEKEICGRYASHFGASCHRRLCYYPWAGRRL